MLLLDIKNTQDSIDLKHLQALEQFEPEIYNGFTAEDCLAYQNQIYLLEYQFSIAKVEIVKLEILKKNLLLNLSDVELEDKLENTIKTLAELETELLNLKKWLEDLVVMIENLNDLFKHCGKKI